MVWSGMDTMKNNLRLAEQGALELKNVAVRYEEMYYTSVNNQSDYLEKICFEMLKLESKSDNLTDDSLQSNSAVATVGSSEFVTCLDLQKMRRPAGSKFDR